MRTRTLIWLLPLTLLLAPMVERAVAQSPVERGRYLVEVIGACGNCHTPKGSAGDLPDKHMAGGFVIEEDFGAAVASNITPDRETGIGAWKDDEIVRAIREGKGRDGRTLGPPMPFYLYRGLSDADVKAIVAYLRTLRPVRNPVARSRYTMPLPPSWGPPAGSVADVSHRDRVKYGEYLAGPVAHCVDCHTPRRPDGTPDTTKLAAGGMAFKGPWGTSYSTNLTADPDSGIGTWIDGKIIASLYGARHDGSRVLPPMPSLYYAGGLAQEDVEAIVAYLRSLPPVKNTVPPPTPPTTKP